MDDDLDMAEAKAGDLVLLTLYGATGEQFDIIIGLVEKQVRKDIFCSIDNFWKFTFFQIST